MLRLSDRPRAAEAVRKLARSADGALFLRELVSFWKDSRTQEHDQSDYLAGEEAVVSRGVSRCLKELVTDVERELKP